MPVDAGHSAARLYLPSCGRFSSGLYLRAIGQLWGVFIADTVKLELQRSFLCYTAPCLENSHYTFSLSPVQACPVPAVGVSTGHDGQLSHNSSVSCICTVAVDPTIGK